MLQMALRDEHLAYGQRQTVHSATLYSERGATLSFLAGWAAEARRLADELRLA